MNQASLSYHGDKEHLWTSLGANWDWGRRGLTIDFLFPIERKQCPSFTPFWLRVCYECTNSRSLTCWGRRSNLSVVIFNWGPEPGQVYILLVAVYPLLGRAGTGAGNCHLQVFSSKLRVLCQDQHTKLIFQGRVSTSDEALLLPVRVCSMLRNVEWIISVSIYLQKNVLLKQKTSILSSLRLRNFIDS